MDGPWGIIGWIRNKLMTNRYVGVFFYKLFSCFFCTGCHSGYIIYLLATHQADWLIRDFILWMLAGGSISFIINLIIESFLNKDSA